MNFNQNVDRKIIDDILESSLWQKAGINVVPRVDESDESEKIGDIEAYSNGVANEYEEPSTMAGDEYAGEEEYADEVSFTLDDLQTVLDNLGDDELMEHALSMLEVFDVAYETLLEGDDDEDEEEDEDEDEDEDEEEEEKVVSERRKYRKYRG